MNTDRTALEGVRVLDVTQVMAGPFCAMQLCDMGADVIKVEPPEGDSTRRMARRDRHRERRVQRRQPRQARHRARPQAAGGAATRFGGCAARRDILIENYRPGVMRGFGLDYDALAADHPALIYASISGYGQTGPDAAKAASISSRRASRG